MRALSSLLLITLMLSTSIAGAAGCNQGSRYHTDLAPMAPNAPRYLHAPWMGGMPSAPMRGGYPARQWFAPAPAMMPMQHPYWAAPRPHSSAAPTTARYPHRASAPAAVAAIEARSEATPATVASSQETASSSDRADRPAILGSVAGESAWVDRNGMTLYTFDSDTAGESNCYGQCAQAWPPLAAAAGAQPFADFTVVSRRDGSEQWAYADQPLYYWIADQQPGDALGDGVNDVWQVARP